jgi:hypothetical protein
VRICRCDAFSRALFDRLLLCVHFRGIACFFDSYVESHFLSLSRTLTLSPILVSCSCLSLLLSFTCLSLFSLYIFFSRFTTPASALTQGRSTIIDARGQFGTAGLGTGLRSTTTTTMLSSFPPIHENDSGANQMSLAHDGGSDDKAADRGSADEADEDADGSDDDAGEDEDEDEVGIPRWGMLMVSDDPSQVRHPHF